MIYPIKSFILPTAVLIVSGSELYTGPSQPIKWTEIARPIKWQCIVEWDRWLTNKSPRCPGCAGWRNAPRVEAPGFVKIMANLCSKFSITKKYWLNMCCAKIFVFDFSNSQLTNNRYVPAASTARAFAALAIASLRGHRHTVWIFHYKLRRYIVGIDLFSLR